MAKLLWDQVGGRTYETGVDQGVLYLANGTGVPWNGLTSVEENSNDESNPLFYDGIKYLDDSIVGDYSATLKAFTYPDEFLDFEGVASISTGLYVGEQKSKQFGLSYRTRVGNDVDGTDHGYKIHLVYNLTAVPDTNSYSTLTDSPSPQEFSWSISSTPQTLSGFAPTAHVIFDTTLLNEFFVDDLEAILYGSSTATARLPSLTELYSIAMNWSLITIKDNGDGTWTATGPDALLTMTNSTTFQITQANATFSDANTYTISDTN